MRALIVLAAALLLPSAAGAQTAPPSGGAVEVEPITCWWRTSATSVRIGETFTVVLTCSLLQTEAARTIADEPRLDPGVVQLPPFDVVSGTRADDLETAGRRFIQFTYTLRVLAENVFATEVTLAPLEITYRIESRVAGAESLAGRDLQYALPPLTMRVLSLVPDTADDIREAPVATFGDIEGVSSRATLLRVSGVLAIALGVLTLGVMAVSVVRKRRADRPTADRRLPAAVILDAARKELMRVRDDVRAGGWSAELAGRALAALRILAAYAAGRPVAQRRVAAAGAARSADGELLVNGPFRHTAVASASAVATADEELQDALARFAAARYGRESRFDARLDEALDAAIGRAERLAAARPLRERLWRR